MRRVEGERDCASGWVEDSENDSRTVTRSNTGAAKLTKNGTERNRVLHGHRLRAPSGSYHPVVEYSV